MRWDSTEFSFLTSTLTIQILSIWIPNKQELLNWWHWWHAGLRSQIPGANRYEQFFYVGSPSGLPLFDHLRSTLILQYLLIDGVTTSEVDSIGPRLPLSDSSYGITEKLMGPMSSLSPPCFASFFRYVRYKVRVRVSNVVSPMYCLQRTKSAFHRSQQYGFNLGGIRTRDRPLQNNFELTL